MKGKLLFSCKQQRLCSGIPLDGDFYSGSTTEQQTTVPYFVTCGWQNNSAGKTTSSALPFGNPYTARNTVMSVSFTWQGTSKPNVSQFNSKNGETLLEFVYLEFHWRKYLLSVSPLHMSI